MYIVLFKTESCDSFVIGPFSCKPKPAEVLALFAEHDPEGVVCEASIRDGDLSKSSKWYTIVRLHPRRPNVICVGDHHDL